MEHWSRGFNWNIGVEALAGGGWLPAEASTPAEAFTPPAGVQTNLRAKY